MSNFFESLKKYFPNGITQEEWEQILIDEEYLEDNVLTSCFHCQDESSAIIINGSSNIFHYIEEQIQKSDILHMHYLEYAKDWLYSAGIFEIPNSEDAINMQAIICRNCGAVLGFSIRGELYYPYMGYLDDSKDILYEAVEREQQKQKTVFRNNHNIKDYRIKDNINNFKYNDKLFEINNNKINLLKKLDNNKNKMSEMLDYDPQAKDIDNFMPILKDTLRALEELNDILEEERR